MSPQESILAFMVVGGGLWVLRPIAGAVARRIGGEIPPPPKGEPDETTLVELHQLREDVNDLAERLDFAERLLAKQRDAQRVGPGS
jgi:hypothetical protein